MTYKNKPVSTINVYVYEYRIVILDELFKKIIVFINRNIFNNIWYIFNNLSWVLAKHSWGVPWPISKFWNFN